MIIRDYVETLCGTTVYVDLIGAQLFALWIDNWLEDVNSDEMSPAHWTSTSDQGVNHSYRSHSTCVCNAFLWDSDDSTSLLE